MSLVDLVMPKLGESIMEATILKWKKQPGERVELDETVLEIATDKVDSEVTAPVAGTLAEILFPENAVVPINTVIARIETAASNGVPAPLPAVASVPSAPVLVEKIEKITPPEVPFVPTNQPITNQPITSKCLSKSTQKRAILARLRCSEAAASRKATCAWMPTGRWTN